jgi:hypothetical protein
MLAFPSVSKARQINFIFTDSEQSNAFNFHPPKDFLVEWLCDLLTLSIRNEGISRNTPNVNILYWYNPKFVQKNLSFHCPLVTKIMSLSPNCITLAK